MARNKRTEIELTAYDDLFETDESRALNTYTHIGYDDAKEELERVENAE